MRLQHASFRIEPHMQTTKETQTSSPPQGSDTLIEGQGLTKHYGDFVAVDGIDFEVVRGECFGWSFEPGDTPDPAKGELCKP